MANKSDKTRNNVELFAKKTYFCILYTWHYYDNTHMTHMKFNHLPLSSLDGTQLNLEALYKIAPSCFTEARDENTGALRHVVDFKKLRQLLGDNAVEDEPEAYDFTWVGKNAARREAATPINKTLRPVPESSVDWDHTQNIYIEGDNLDALKLLQKSYLGGEGKGVKMIYIDPPYNTGNDFVYHDDFHRTQAEEDLEAGNVDELGNRFVKNTETNGKFHSDWCSMIYPRLQLAHSLLSEDGLIFISIDEHESHNLRKICDEVFGENNFVSQIVWEKRFTRSNNSHTFTTLTEPIMVYRKSEIVTDIKEPRSDKADSIYSNPDNDPRGVWTSVSYVNPATKTQRPNLSYSLINPFTHKEVIHPTNAWKFSKEVYEKHVKENRLYWGKDGDNTYPRLKKFLSEMEGGMVPVDLWKQEETGTTDKASKELAALLSGKFFDFPKPVSLIKRIISLVINQKVDKEAIILDFFSGSATTAHAVMQLNAEDGGHRKFILVQLPEETDENSEAYKAGYKNICEIGEERIRRAGKKIQDELKAKQPDLFDNENGQSLDTGFRVFRIDSSNMKDVYFAPKDLDPKQIDLFADNVKEDRTELDLLYGCIVDWGLKLSLPLSTETINGVTVYTVNNGDLVACFGKPITDDVVKAMASKAPLRILFRDSCFEKDEQKINIYERFKQLCNWNDDEALNKIRVI